jgi:3D (Asp-Asp-Asp) domain-containing protein
VLACGLLGTLVRKRGGSAQPARPAGQASRSVGMPPLSATVQSPGAPEASAAAAERNASRVIPHKPIRSDRLALEAKGAPPAAAPPSPPKARVARAAARTSGRPARKLQMVVTAYCPCRKCCGRHSDGKTASGRSIYANGSRFVAADTRLLPFGTRLSVPGYHAGAPVPVLDRGGRIKGNRLDVFFLSHERARKWGVRRLEVTVWAD